MCQRWMGHYVNHLISRFKEQGMEGKNVKGWGGELGNDVVWIGQGCCTNELEQRGCLLKDCMTLSQSAILHGWRSDFWNLPLGMALSGGKVTFIRAMGCQQVMHMPVDNPTCVCMAALIGPSGLLIKKKKGQLLRVLASLPKNLSLVPSSQVRISGFPTQIHTWVYT